LLAAREVLVQECVAFTLVETERPLRERVPKAVNHKTREHPLHCIPNHTYGLFAELTHGQLGCRPLIDFFEALRCQPAVVKPDSLVVVDKAIDAKFMYRWRNTAKMVELEFGVIAI